MTNRPLCPKGRRKNGSPCVFCQDGSYCAHQYYCPSTRRYENSGYRDCRKLKNVHPNEPEGKQEVRNGQKKVNTRKRRKS